jgi:hypothetical protein
MTARIFTDHLGTDAFVRPAEQSTAAAPFVPQEFCKTGKGTTSVVPLGATKSAALAAEGPLSRFLI